MLNQTEANELCDEALLRLDLTALPAGFNRSRHDRAALGPVFHLFPSAIAVIVELRHTDVPASVTLAINPF